MQLYNHSEKYQFWIESGVQYLCKVIGSTGGFKKVLFEDFTRETYMGKILSLVLSKLKLRSRR